MHDRETVELFLLAREEGMCVSAASAFAGVSRRTGRHWEHGELPRSLAGDGRISAGKPAKRKGADVDIRGLYDPPETGPLSGLAPDKIENALLRAVLDDLKAGGSLPASTSTASLCALAGRLIAATGLSQTLILRFLGIARSTYHYHRRRAGVDKYAALRARVREVFEELGRSRGYRPVWARLRAEGTRVSEKVVRRIMREEGLRPAYLRRRRRRYSSYAGEIGDAPPNLPPVIDCFDGRPVSWSAGTRPAAGLADSSLLVACATLSPGERPVIHSDRGCHYRWPGWLAACEGHGLTRSMSRKGTSGDNARAEGFFGLLKNEFYRCRDWAGVSAEAFIAELDAWMGWYRSGRAKMSLGWRTMDENRRALGYSS